MQFDMQDLRNPLEHDILVARRHLTGRQYFRIKAGREQGRGGAPTERAEYTTITEQLPSDPGFRAIIGLACLEGAQTAAPRGPALAALPLHPDPTASASCTCYLINPENVTYETAWTTEEWTDQEIQPSDNPITTDDAFELLVATPAGKVYLISKTQGTTPVSSKLVRIDLEAELWSTLRGGTVAGSVRLVSEAPGPRVVPVVNVQALMPSKPTSNVVNGAASTEDGHVV